MHERVLLIKLDGNKLLFTYKYKKLVHKFLKQKLLMRYCCLILSEAMMNQSLWSTERKE